MLNLPDAMLYGLDDTALVPYQSGDKHTFLLEAATAQAFSKMQMAARHDGIVLEVASAHRSFQRQLHIWNGKARGERPLLNANAEPIADIRQLPPNELLQTILLWSALPGTSRHHWGTDIDLFDNSQLQRAQLQLVNHEYQPGGPCFAMHQWLSAHAQRFGFFRPFQAGLSGTSAELWHYSYHPVAEQRLKRYRLQHLETLLAASDICLKAVILEQLPALVKRYVFTVAPAPTAPTSNSS
ncbi:M15 family metallopeptidase [Shewanella sp. YIC-542]|uniref:M15 family metallopeptidase n=1 Tax=Shewanella mytili TaxID=3377111 RepID=UPI00398E929F